MFLLQSDELLDHAKDIIHKDTQHHKLSIDLTIAEIYQLTGPGSLDFGGSEFSPAERKVIQSEKRNPNDEYGWWNLDGGTYIAVFNEQLQKHEDTLAVLSPHSHANEAGIITSTNLITSEVNMDQITINFQVPSIGCRIKENARFATLHILAD